MAGKNTLTSILVPCRLFPCFFRKEFIRCLSLLFSRTGFAFLFLALSVLPAGAQEGRTIAVLLSSSEQVYANTATSFKAEAGASVRIFNLQGDIKRNPSLKGELLAGDPGLIFALGAKAAYVAKLWTRKRPDIKVLFAMVLNWQKYGLLRGQDNIAGIAAEVAPGTQFVNLITFVPTVKKIGVIYSAKNSSDIIAKARKTAKLLGLELIAVPIDRPGEFQGSYKKIRGQIDAFWVLNDPITYSLNNMAWITVKCIKDRLVCLGQSKNIAEEGLWLSR